MTVHIPSALWSYTGQQRELQAEGRTVGDTLTAVEARYPGLRFRIVTEQDEIRPHIRIFVNGEQARDLAAEVRTDDHLYIVCALSGG